tara:strand:- start:195 stop:425 length:231 start_codon:yes stop_codon:yes gene_type:complete
MTTQPEALRLAEWIEEDMSCIGDAEIAAELRRLHDVNIELLEALKALSDADETEYVSITLWIKARAVINKVEGEMK